MSERNKGRARRLRPYSAGSIRIRIDPADAIHEIEQQYNRAEQAEAEIERLKAEQAERKPSPKQVIERYYRAKGQNPKITLKQICEQMNVNYDSIRVAKVTYDKRRRR